MYPIPMCQLEELGFQQPGKSLFPVFLLVLVKQIAYSHWFEL